jgi:hypothetical protein
VSVSARAKTVAKANGKTTERRSEFIPDLTSFRGGKKRNGRPAKESVAARRAVARVFPCAPSTSIASPASAEI